MKMDDFPVEMSDEFVYSIEFGEGFGLTAEMIRKSEQNSEKLEPGKRRRPSKATSITPFRLSWGNKRLAD